MYYLPGYTEYHEENGILYITSKLFQNKVKISDPALRQEFYNIVQRGGSLEISTPLTKFLHEQELLANNNEVMQAITQVKKQLDKILIITIMPTENCNFRCPYCYESHEAITMSQEVLDRIYDYIAEEAHNFETLQINWFGGEPTLCKEMVLETALRIQKLEKTANFKYVSNMTTNGYLLTSELFKSFYKAGITAYQITLDGWGHDQTRPLVSGKGTLETILRNLTDIAKMPKEEFDFCITLRHNILPGDHDFSWYDHLYSLFGSDSRFEVLVRPVGDWGGDSVQSMEILSGDARDELVLEHIGYLRKIGMKTANGKVGPYTKICHANYPHSMVFRPNGKIEKCTVALDHPNNALGKVDPAAGIQIDPVVNALWTYSEFKPECSACPNVLACLNMQCRKKLLTEGCTESRCSEALSAIY